MSKEVESEDEDTKSKRSKKKEEKKAFFDGKAEGCVVCSAQIVKGDTFGHTDSVMDLTDDKVTMSFYEFIKSLMGRDDGGISKQDREKAKGCQVLMPSTIFFKGDKIDFISGNEKGFMSSKVPGTFINLHRDALKDEVADRKKRTGLHSY